MLLVPEALVCAAQDAGIPVPTSLTDYDVDRYPFWHVFVLLQLECPMPYPSVHYANAHLISSIPEEKLKKFTYFDFIKEGFQEGNPND